MAMTRKHYREFADAVHSMLDGDLPESVTTPELTRYYLAGWMQSSLSEILRRDNPNFDSKRFEDWCENGTDKR